MSEDTEKPFLAEVAKQGRATCKKCKQNCPKGELRIAKLAPNPFGDGKMKNWHHVSCLFETFLKQRQSTKKIDSPEDIDGWDILNEDHKEEIVKLIQECHEAFHTKYGTPIPKKISPRAKKASPKQTPVAKDAGGFKGLINKDNLFKEFRRLVCNIANVSSYTEKTALVQKMFEEGVSGKGFQGDIILWCKLLLPGVVKRIYNLQSKQLVKLFSRIFRTDQKDMLEHLEQGDVAETIQHFFESSSSFKPAKKSLLTIEEVDSFLERLSKLTKEEDQINHFTNFASNCTSNDLKLVIRLIKHDLRMNAGAKHVLDGVHPDAYQAYQSSRDIEAVVSRCLGKETKTTGNGTVKATVSVMTPVLPMLAEACKSVEQAMKKCPNGMYSEIKYDGERVQVHKKGSDFKYFSRSLKPVMNHKIAHFKEYIGQAFPQASDLILDSEILMIDTKTGKPLPFGSLGVHKRDEFKDACVCLFVFDCIYYNGESLTSKPITYRKKILQENMTEIPNHIVFSEMEEIHQSQDLAQMIAKVLKQGLEGLVLKDLDSIYEPGKRHWLKVKKDYLFGGAMADSADLIVLGAWYGTGKKGGMMSVFLMGSYDQRSKKFCTVTKVHTGHDDKTLENLQTELDMIKISMDPNKVPDWLNCTKTMIPDFVARDPKNQPIWEITGAEFTQQHDVHTANGISIRFPRVTKIRHDKTWETATNVAELTTLFKNSKENFDPTLLLQTASTSPSPSSSPKKRKIDKEPEVSPKRTKLNKFEDVTKCIQNPIPDYFLDVKAVFMDDVKTLKPDVFRYFVAYGGTVLSSHQCGEATHVVHAKNVIELKDLKKFPSNCRHVIGDWILASINKESLVDFKPYSVLLD